jgi:integrase
MAWDAETRRRRQLGPLALSQLTRPIPTLGEWIQERWVPEHAAMLEQSTRTRYDSAYRRHIEPWLDHVPLHELTVGRLRAWQVALLDAGVSPVSIQKARTLLSSVLRHAAEAEAIAGNPLSLVRAPKADQRDSVRPLTPSTVELIRRVMLEPRTREVGASGAGQRRRRAYVLPGPTHHNRRRDALIVSLLAYARLRPGELHALRWRDIREHTLLVERATAPDGSIKPTKTGRARAVRLMAPLAAEVREWHLARGRPSEDALILPGPGGRAWAATDRNNWRRRVWIPACRTAGLDPAPVPYHLRHSFASLLLAEGRQPLYVAQQLGHTPAVLLSTYAHLLPELAEAGRVEPELEIAKARAREAQRMYALSTLSPRPALHQRLRPTTKAGDLQGFSESGSDGTRTRDLCRDRAAL